MSEPNPLINAPAIAARREFARIAAGSIVRSGAALWAFGLVTDSPRRALAIATQSAGSLAIGISKLLETGNWYAAAALLRQLIEAEYLVWLFGEDRNECSDWLTLTGDTARAKFRPAKLRRRAAGKFADNEYWTHCEIGGHPHPRGTHLLPERLLQPSAAEGLEALLWLESAAHLERFWQALAWSIQQLELSHIVTISDAQDAVQSALEVWRARDPLGAEFVTRLGVADEDTSAAAE